MPKNQSINQQTQQTLAIPKKNSSGEDGGIFDVLEDTKVLHLRKRRDDTCVDVRDERWRLCGAKILDHLYKTDQPQSTRLAERQVGSGRARQAPKAKTARLAVQGPTASASRARNSQKAAPRAKKKADPNSPPPKAKRQRPATARKDRPGQPAAYCQRPRARRACGRSQQRKTRSKT